MRRLSLFYIFFFSSLSAYSKPAVVLSFLASNLEGPFNKVQIKAVLDDLTQEVVSSSRNANGFEKTIRFVNSHLEMLAYKTGQRNSTLFTSDKKLVIRYTQSVGSKVPDVDVLSFYKELEFIITTDSVLGDRPAIFKSTKSTDTYSMYGFIIRSTNAPYYHPSTLAVYSPEQQIAYAPFGYSKAKTPINENHIVFDNNMKGFYLLNNRKRVSHTLDLVLIDSTSLNTVIGLSEDTAYRNMDSLNKAAMSGKFFNKIYRQLNADAAAAFLLPVQAPKDTLPPPLEEQQGSADGIEDSSIQ